MITMLLVAPATDLEYADAEMQALVNMTGLRVRLVKAPCTTLAIYAAVEQIGRCDWLHIAGHGSEGGVHLDGGEVWGASEIAMTAQSLSCHLTWINTCDSVHLAKAVTENTPSDCIVNLVEANDQRAWQLPVHFARRLFKTNPVDAFLKTAASDRNVLYVRNLNG